MESVTNANGAVAFQDLDLGAFFVNDVGGPDGAATDTTVSNDDGTGGATGTQGADGNATKLGLAPPKLSPADLLLILDAIRSKTEEGTLKSSKEGVQDIMQRKQNEATERLAKLDEQIKAAEKGKKSGEIGKVFSWIAAAAMTLAGAILLATGVGTAAGVALLAGGIAMMTVLALQETGGMDKMMEGLTASIMKTFPDLSPEDARIFATCVVGAAIAAVAVVGTVFGGPAVGIAIASTFLSAVMSPENLQAMGVPEDKAGWVSLGISIGLAVAGIAGGVGAAVRGASSATTAATKVADVASKAITKALEKIPQLAGQGAQAMQKAGALMGYVAQAIAGLAAVGQGSSAIVTADATHDAKNAEADVAEFDKILIKLQQLFQDEGDRIKEIIQRLQDSVSVVVDVLKNDAQLNERTVAV